MHTEGGEGRKPLPPKRKEDETGLLSIHHTRRGECLPHPPSPSSFLPNDLPVVRCDLLPTNSEGRKEESHRQKIDSKGGSDPP